MVDDYVEKSHEMQMRQEVGVVNRSHSMKSTVLLCIYMFAGDIVQSQRTAKFEC